MKHYILYIIPLLVLFTACNELNTYPKDAVNSEYYFKNESQLEQYSNQFYTLFPGAASMYNEVSDEIAIAELADEVRGTRTTPTDNSGTNWNWSMLRHINYLLEHVNQCTDKEAAKQYTGLALFFRAYLYYDRVRHYGDVPWIDHTLGSNDPLLYAARTDRKVVMRHVMADLDSAAKCLPATKSSVYRVNKYAALAMKSRIALFEGTWHRYHSDEMCKPFADSMLTFAYQAADSVMTNGGYMLYGAGGGDTLAYRTLFNQGTYEGCSEFILARCYNRALNQYHNLNSFTFSPTTGKPGFTKRFVNQYLMRDGSRFTDSIKRPDWRTMGMAQEMTNRDPRMEQTIFRPGHYVQKGETEVASYDVRISSTGYQLIKYVMGKDKDGYNQSDCDMPLIRLAEVYLNYAEAKAELNDFTQTDADKSINLLRARACMPAMTVSDAESKPCWYMKSLYPNVSLTKGKEGIILEIRRERDVELVQEGFRYWDLMRWKEGQAFEQPYLGMSFKGVTKSSTDKSGFVDVTGNGKYDVCVHNGSYRIYFGCVYLRVNKDITLTDSVNGGNILNNGSQDLPNNGRKWNEYKDYLYPIPINEITLTSGAIKQNPGW